MTKTNDENQASLQSAWTTGHAAAVTTINQAGIEDHKVILGPTRTGMSAGPILPQVLDLVNKPKC